MLQSFVLHSGWSKYNSTLKNCYQLVWKYFPNSISNIYLDISIFPSLKGQLSWLYYRHGFNVLKNMKRYRISTNLILSILWVQLAGFDRYRLIFHCRCLRCRRIYNYGMEIYAMLTFDLSIKKMAKGIVEQETPNSLKLWLKIQIARFLVCARHRCT